jgi:hypothetical protein
MANRATVRRITDKRDEALNRVWERIVKEEARDCWIWTGPCQSKGYGLLTLPGRQTWLVHRLLYTIFYAPLSNDVTLDHLCSNRRCVNPEHLEPVASRINIGRGSTNKWIGSNRYRGVHRHRERWAVQVCVHGRTIHAGSFEEIEVAAMQANVLRARYFPGFRAWNQVEMG